MTVAYTESTVLGLVKARLNRLASDTSLDDYLKKRIEAVDAEMTRLGIALVAGNTEDEMLLTDIAVWQHQNRDKPGAMPEWLRLRRRERWLSQRARSEEAGT